MTNSIPKIPQTRDHLSVSETVIGLIYSGKITATGFNPDYFSGDYAKILRDIQSGVPTSDLYVKYSSLLDTARMAAGSVKGWEDMDWREIVYKSHIQSEIINLTQSALKQMERGNTDGFLETQKRIQALSSSSARQRSVRANEIGDDYTPFIKSGMNAWDRHIGGLPAVGMVIMAGLWSSGKTTNAITMMDCYLREYPEREVLFVTLEDMNEGWKDRARVMLEERAESFWERIHVMEFAQNSSEIIEEAMRWERVGLIIVDYVDYMSKADNTAFDEMYQILSMGAKEVAVNREFRNCTVVALAQINKGNYNGGVPEEKCLPYNAGQRYTYQLVMMYNSNSDFHADNPDNPYVLPAVPGYEYLVWWKVKNGCRPHIGEFPGAIRLPWTNQRGFDMSGDGEWVALTNETKRPVQKRK